MTAAILRRMYRPLRRARFRVEMWWQRITDGASEEDSWSLDYHLARVTVAGVKHLREGHAYPAAFSDDEHGTVGGGWEAWDAILARIEDGFQVWIDNDGLSLDTDSEARFNDAMSLYAEWFNALWN